jgi:hypothetical protein
MQKLTFDRVWNDLGELLTEGITILTLSRNQPNQITDFSEEGIEVMTKRSSPNRRLVPKWMFEEAVNYLIENGSLTNNTLLNELIVKRSSFVLAALSQLDYVGFESDPMKIFLKL